MRLDQSYYFLRILTEKKPPSNKTSALTKYMNMMNMDIWVVGISKQLFIQEVLKLNEVFQKNKVVTGKSLFFVTGEFMYSRFYWS